MVTCGLSEYAGMMLDYAFAAITSSFKGYF